MKPTHGLRKLSSNTSWIFIIAQTILAKEVVYCLTERYHWS